MIIKGAEISTFNKCVHIEKGNNGYYFGLNRIWDFEVLPWIRNDGYRGFIEWLFFRYGWYPIGEKRQKIEKERRNQ